MAKDLNTATAADLAEIPQMSSARAETIIHFRDSHGPFSDMSELSQIPGIGETMAAQVAEYFGIVPAPRSSRTGKQSSKLQEVTDEDEDNSEEQEESTTAETDSEQRPVRSRNSSGEGGTNKEGLRLNKDGSVDKRQFNRAPSEEGGPGNTAEEELGSQQSRG